MARLLVLRQRTLLVTLLAVTRLERMWRYVSAHHRLWQWSWRIMTKRDIVVRVERYMTADQLVLIPAAQLDDLLELARLAAERIPDPDPLRAALIGAIGAVRLAATIEP